MSEQYNEQTLDLHKKLYTAVKLQNLLRTPQLRDTMSTISMLLWFLRVEKEETLIWKRLKAMLNGMNLGKIFRMEG